MIFKLYFLKGIICLSFLLVTLIRAEILPGTEESLNNLKSAKELKDSESEKFIENLTENPVQLNEDEESFEDDKNSSHVLNVLQLTLNDEDKVMLQNLKGIIEKVPEEKESETTAREGKSFKDENLRRAAEALTDEEITEIIKSISFPNNDEITEDGEIIRHGSESDIEPRMGRSMKKQQGQGYYVIAFTPIEEENDNKSQDSLPYTRLQILPAERSLTVDDNEENPRFMSKKSWNRYIRRIMRQIRKGTRKIKRKTKVKSIKEEKTIEDFLKRMYEINQAQRLKHQTKKKSSWFLW